MVAWDLFASHMNNKVKFSIEKFATEVPDTWQLLSWFQASLRIVPENSALVHCISGATIGGGGTK